jgi:release factor glutamine methyltransferase
MTNIKDALKVGRKILSESSPSAQLDVEVLLSKVLKTNKAYLYTYPETSLTEEEENQYLSLVSARDNGEPIAYLVGMREFWSLPFQVTNSTLIPRPETELLVEKTLENIDSSKSASILELGTGSGAIAIAIAHARPNWNLIAAEKSESALKVAIKNAEQLEIKNIKFILSDWFSKVDELSFDCIISNPPYIAENDPHLSSGDVRFEPNEALISGANGLESLQNIIKHGYDYLASNGILLLEHGYDQRVAVGKLLGQYGYQDVECWQDLQKKDRVSIGKRKKKP